MSNKLTSIDNFKSFVHHIFVSVANGKNAYVKGKGKINLLSSKIESDVLFLHSFLFQLLSVSKITATLNCEVIFTSSKVVFQDLVTKKMTGEGFFLHGLYYISHKSPVPRIFQATINHSHEHLLWHRRLAHPSKFVLSKIKFVPIQEPFNCEICHFLKSTRLPFSLSKSKTTHVFELIHSDVWGPFYAFIDGFKYFVSFIDDFFRVTWVYLLKTKHDVFDCFKDFHSFMLNQYSTYIKILRSDNGTEYMSKDMSKYLHSNRIVHQTSCVGTPQQNGIFERKNRDLLEKTRAIILQMNVPKHFWSYGILIAVYLINRLPSRVLEFKSPLEVLQNKVPDISHIKVFG